MPGATKPLPEPMLTSHKSGFVASHESNFILRVQATILCDEFENWRWKYVSTSTRAISHHMIYTPCV